jgi:hypothetical protein
VVESGIGFELNSRLGLPHPDQMNSLSSSAAEIPRPASPMQLENQASNPQAKLEISSHSMVDGTPQDEEPKASLSKKPRKKLAKSQNARAGSAGPPVQADANGEPVYRLSRVQKIVKMSELCGQELTRNTADGLMQTNRLIFREKPYSSWR